MSSPAEVNRVADAAFKRFADIAFLMNHTVAFEGGDALSNPHAWRRVLDVNVLGVLNGVQSIGRTMIDCGKRGVIVNTGRSKALLRRREIGLQCEQSRR